MQVTPSLKQTITHLFDAVKYSDHATELEESARSIEGDLETALNKLEAQTEEMSNLLAAMRVEREDALKELSRQVDGFLATAKEQAKGKLQKGARHQLEDYRKAISSEKDKALKSLEAYFAAEPIPVLENVIQVRLDEGIYEARSSYECEGGIKYEFRLAAHNSQIFHEPLSLSRLGYELRIPVRFSRALLSKSRTPGFERLDQYVLSDAETSGGRLRANFDKAGNGAKMKVVTSGNQEDGFVSLEYSDQLQAVNVMNDPSLVAHVEINPIKQAAAAIVSELNELSKKKVALLRMSIDGEGTLNEVNCREILQRVLAVMGGSYRDLIRKMASSDSAAEGEDMDLNFIRGRLKVLGGDLSKSVSQTLGLTAE